MPANFDEGGVKTERIREFQMLNTKYLTKRTILLQMQRHFFLSKEWRDGGTSLHINIFIYFLISWYHFNIPFMFEFVSNFFSKERWDGGISLQFHVNLCLKTLVWQFLFCMFIKLIKIAYRWLKYVGQSP